MVIIQYDEHNRRYHVTIPPEVIDLKGWLKGTGIVFTVDKDRNVGVMELP